VAKRIYAESAKKWAVKAGIPITAGLIFIYIMYTISIGAMVITDTRWSDKCAGTLEELCWVEYDFYVNEDVFWYPMDYDPWGRETSFQFNPELESWKLKRSWGSSWREIHLDKACTSTWCGAPPNSPDNKYAIAWRTGKTYTIRIEGMKKSIVDDIVVKFNPEITWNGYKTDDFFTELISNKASISYGEAIFIIKNPLAYEIPADKFLVDIENFKGSGVYDIEYYILKNYTVNITDYKYTSIKKTCWTNETFGDPSLIDPDKPGEQYDCSYYEREVSGYHDEYELRYESWNPKGYKLFPGEHQIKIVGRWNAQMGPQKREWIPEIEIEDTKFVQSKWAWWNATFAKCKPITIASVSGTDLDDFPALINVTYDSDMESDFLDIRFVNGSTCSSGGTEVAYDLDTKYDGLYALYHVRTEIPSGGKTLLMYYDDEFAENGENETGAWDENFITVQHMDEYNSSHIRGVTQNFLNATEQGTVTEDSDGNCVIGKCMTFPGSADYFQFSRDTDFVDGTDVRTITGWFNTDVNNLGDRIFGYGAWTGNNRAFDFLFSGSTKQFLAGYVVNYEGNLSISTNTWYYFSLKIEASKVKMTLNNVSSDDASSTVNTVLSGNSRIGKGVTADANQEMDGEIDEMRYSDVARSYGWIDMEYSMVIQQADLVSFGSEETSGDTVSPTMTLTPANGTDYEAKFDINVTVNENADWCWYNFDAGTNATMNNDSLTNWFIEATASTRGTRQIYIYCNDTTGNWGLNNTQYIDWNLVPPNVDFVTPTSTNGTESDDIEYISWNITVNEDVGAGRFTINGTNQTCTSSNATTNSYCIYNETGITTNQTRCADGWASDSVDNWNHTDFTICRSTSIQVLPLVLKIYYPANTSATTAGRWINWTNASEVYWAVYSLNDGPNTTLLQLEDDTDDDASSTGTINNVTDAYDEDWETNATCASGTCNIIQNFTAPVGWDELNLTFTYKESDETGANKAAWYCEDGADSWGTLQSPTTADPTNISVDIYDDGSVKEACIDQIQAVGEFRIKTTFPVGPKIYDAKVLWYGTGDPINDSITSAVGQNNITVWANTTLGGAHLVTNFTSQWWYYDILNLSVAYSNDFGTYSLNTSTGTISFNWTYNTVTWYNATPNNQNTSLGPWNVTSEMNAANIKILGYLNQSIGCMSVWLVNDSTDLLDVSVGFNLSSTTNYTLNTTVTPGTDNMYWNWVDMINCTVGTGYYDVIRFAAVDA